MLLELVVKELSAIIILCFDSVYIDGCSFT